MGNPFTSTSVSSYNANPPADDGSLIASNIVAWSTIKPKLSDPIKTAFDISETSTNAAFSKVVGGASITTTAVDYTVLAADQSKLIKCTVSGKTITTPDATSVGAPFVFYLVNSSTGNITFAGNNPGVQQNVDGVASITVPAGNGLFAATDGTNWYTAGQNFTVSFPPQAAKKNLSIKVASNTTVAVAADYVVTTNGAGKFQTTAVSSTVNLGTSAVIDALDAGTIAIDSWYHIWVIAKADGTTKCVASLQSTATATFLSNLAAIASGAYTYYARIGAVQTIHGSATLYGTWQIGCRAQYVVGLAQTSSIVVLASSTAGSVTVPTWSALALTRFAPSTASRVTVGVFTHDNATNQVMVAPNSSYGNLASQNVYFCYGGAGTGTSTYVSSAFDMLLESTSIYWASASTTAQISCLGWEDNI